MGAHPEHDVVNREVRCWYTAATPEIGISAAPTSFGVLTASDRAQIRRLVLTEDWPARVADAVEAASEFFGGSDFEVWVEDRARAQRLTADLATAGFQPAGTTVVLALVGSVRADPGPDKLAVEDIVDPDGLQEWATVKLQGFADSETSPAGEQLQAEMAVRQAEWPVCRYQLGRLDDQAVAILGHYTGRDQMVFLLATRLPFRHRGIAQAMLAQWIDQAEGQGVRSFLINCDDGGPASALYRRLGFTDAVYWYRPYRHSP